MISYLYMYMKAWNGLKLSVYQSSYNTCDFLLARLWYFSYTSDVCCALYQTCVQLSINIYSTRVSSLYTFLLLIQNLHYAFVQDFLFVFCCMLNKSSHLFSLKTIKQNNKGIPSKVFRNILIFSRENHAEFSFHFIFLQIITLHTLPHMECSIHSGLVP